MPQKLVWLSGLVVLATLSLVIGAQPVAGAAARSDVRLAHGRAVEMPRLSTEGPQLRQRGRWLVDGRGRVVTLHGFNMMNKLPPYLVGPIGFGDDDARFLAREGFNFVRLGVDYAALEPRPGRFSRRYIRGLVSTVRILASHRIYVLLSSDNNCYGPKFGGQGMPGWMSRDDGLPSTGSRLGFPSCYVTFADAGMNRAWDHFWADDAASDGVGLQQHYVRGWTRLARTFASNPFVLGYDTLNEPWAGTTAATCASPAGCPAFEAGPLTDFTARITAALKKADRSSIVFGEPQLLFDFGARSWLRRFGHRNVGFSFHSYCIPELLSSAYGGDTTTPGCQLSDDTTFDNAMKTAAATASIPVLTEFGATDSLGTLRRIATAADRRMLSWAEWTYYGKDPCCPRPQEGIIRDLRQPPEGRNIKHHKLRVLARPYPRAIAGTPLSWSYHPGTRVFRLRYSPVKVGSSVPFPRRVPTEIVLPPKVWAGRLQIHSTNAVTRTSQHGRTLLVLAKHRCAEVQVTIRPAR